MKICFGFTYVFWLLVMPYITVLWNWGDYKQKDRLFNQNVVAFHAAGITIHSTINSPSGLYGEWSVLVTLICWQFLEPQFYISISKHVFTFSLGESYQVTQWMDG
jgi:hypothetical protein